MKKLTGGLILMVYAALAFAQFPTGLPQSLTKNIQPISVEEEMVIGHDVAANVIAQFGLYGDEALSEYVSLTGLTVAQYSPKQDVPYRFTVLNSNILNAFAAPGGYIFITKGLLNQLTDEAQLACILGHEIAHVSQRHVIKEIQKSRMVDAAISPYAKAAAEKNKYTKQVTDLAVQMIWKGLSREDELESDKLGLEYARAAGYDATAFKEVLETLKAKAQTPQGFDHELKFMLSTHPKPEDRLKVIQEKLTFISMGGMRVRDRFQSFLLSLK